MSKVFAPQIPSRYDIALGKRVPSFDMRSAEQFGELVACVPTDADFRVPLDELIAHLEKSLFKFSEDDYLIAIGDPLLIAAAAVICSMHTDGRMRMLRWHRVEQRYIQVEFTI
jgi:hypothetical protein